MITSFFSWKKMIACKVKSHKTKLKDKTKTSGKHLYQGLQFPKTLESIFPWVFFFIKSTFVLQVIDIMLYVICNKNTLYQILDLRGKYIYSELFTPKITEFG